MDGNMNNLECIHIEAGIVAAYDYVATRGFEIVDVIGCGNITTGGAASQPQTNIAGAGLVDLGTLLNCDTADDIEYMNTLVAAQATMAAGDTLRIDQEVAGVAGQADLYTWVIPTTWIAG